MAIEYSLLFREKIDSIETWAKTISQIGVSTYIGEIFNDHLMIGINKSHGLVLSISHSEGYINLSFEKFHYKTECSVRIDKSNYNRGIENLLFFTKELTNKIEAEFVLVFNGELVILHAKEGKILLNRHNNFWDLNDSSIFTNTEDCEYPII